MSERVGFLHTSPVHVPTFRALLAQIAPGAVGVHLVDEDLLARLRGRRFDASIQERLLGRLRELAEHAPDVIVCTCSTVSGHAERLSRQVGAPVLRIDRPMAERAVARGGRVALVAAVESTLGPTRELLEQCAAACGSGAVVVDAPCPQAWALFEAGDHAGYHALVARHVRDLAGDVDVVVLAQASMAPAAELLRDLAVPVLSSPRLAVLRAVEIAEGAG
jgi:aspartate/glutamate racemase